MFGRLTTGINALFFLTAAAAWAEPVISEFMASNLTTLKDGYGNYEDWIEIWNPDAAAAELAGWRLTDSAGKPDKFVFPALALPPNGRVVVFASSRAGSTGAATVVDPLGYRHTNFSLSKDGEYLALIQPDGVTKTTELNPYPAQIADISYGPPESVETLVGGTSAVRFTVPTNTLYDTASPNWTQTAFSDASWAAATGSGVGFEAGSPLGAWLLDEEAGATSAADCTGGSLNAATNGTGQTFGLPGAHAGSATSVSFSGAGGLTVPYAAALNPPSTFTFAAWVYPTGGSGTYRTVVSSRVGPSGLQRGYILYLSPANAWEFWTGNPGGWQILSGGAATLNAWTHLAITRDASGVKRIYVNGVLKGLAAQSYQPNNNPANGFHLGCGDDLGQQYRLVGRIDDAAFWGHDIGAELVDLHRAEGLQSLPTPLYPAHFQTDVHDPMRGVNPGLYSRHAFTISDRTRYSALRLRVKYDDGFVAYLNGTEILRRNVSGVRAFNTLADSDRDDSQAVAYEDTDISASALPALANGTNTLALHGMTFVPAASAFLLTPVLQAALVPEALPAGYFATATPGAANAAQSVAPGPGISEVVHAPQQPEAATAVTVSARVTPRLGTLQAVALVYRVNYGAESAPVALADAGPYPGADDGSRLYTGVIPSTHGAAARQLLRYRLTAADGAGRTWRAPYPTDLANDDGVSQSPEYFGTVIADPALTASMPVMQWFTADVPNSDTRTGARASAWYEGRFYDNLYVRQRGGYTSTGSQKFNFNRGDNLWVNDTLGKVGEVNLNSSGADSYAFRVSAAYAVYRAAGHPACESFPVALYRNGAFHRMAHLIEQVDDEFLKRHGFDRNGALYKFVQRLGEQNTPGNVVNGDYSGSPAFNYEHPIYGVEKKTRLYESFADYSAFTAAIAPSNALASRKTYLFDNLNIPTFVNFMAIRSLIAEIDVNRKNFYAYRDSDGSGEWFLFPWDKDMTFGVSYSTDPAANRNNPWQSTDTFKHDPAGTRQWCVLWQNGYDVPEIRAMVGRRLRTLMDGMMGAPGTPVPGTAPIELLADAVLAQLASPPPGYTPTSSYANRSTFNSWLANHRTALFTTYGPGSAYGMIPAVASGSPAVAISEVVPAPDTASPGFLPYQHEHLVLTNAGAEDVDLSGWTVWKSGADEPFFTFACGTVLPGVSLAPLNRLHVGRSLPGFRARPGAPDEAEFAVGCYGGRIADAEGGTVELRAGLLASSPLVSALAVASSPSPAQRYLRVTELLFAPAAPSAGELALAPGTGAKDYEFIELENIGAVPLDLAGARFTDGVAFTFPDLTLAPGQRVLVVADATAFAARYGSVGLIAGAFEGNFDNDGEHLRINDASGETILDFTYDPRWFPPASGEGYSLVVRADAPDPAAYGAAMAWALSGVAGGTPGAADNGDFAYHYDGWLRDYFLESDIYLPVPENPPDTMNEALVGPEADPDGDGVINLAEYAFVRDPRAAGAPVFVLDMLEDGGPHLTLSFTRPRKALDLTYTVETAALPAGPWASGALTNGPVLDLGNGLERVSFRIPASSAPAGFLRVRVTR
jgi:hypothetical protein